MRQDGPYIEVQHSDDNLGAQAVASTYDMDKGPLSIPEHTKIGGLSWDKCKIENYDQQVDEYDVWLHDMLRAQTPAVLNALDDIYNKAIANGVILKTRCCPQPYRTHAHVVKRLIEELAAS